VYEAKRLSPTIVRPHLGHFLSSFMVFSSRPRAHSSGCVCGLTGLAFTRHDSKMSVAEVLQTRIV
jgi:hypothetical protein